MNEQLVIRNSRLGHLIILLALLLLSSVVLWAFFFKEQPFQKGSVGMFICIISSILICVMLYFNLKMIIKNPAVITINEQGFEYNPGGISSGWIPWSNVQEIKFVDVRTSSQNPENIKFKTAIAVKLNDNTTYLNQYNFALKALIKLNTEKYNADILFRKSDFGKKYNEVYDLVNRYWVISKRPRH